MLSTANPGKINYSSGGNGSIGHLPGLPAIAETYPGFQTITWNGLLTPAGTPRDVVNKLAAEVKKW